MLPSIENLTDDNCIQERIERLPMCGLPKKELQKACQCPCRDKSPSNNVPTTSAWLWTSKSKTNCTESDESNCTQLRYFKINLTSMKLLKMIFFIRVLSNILHIY